MAKLKSTGKRGTRAKRVYRSRVRSEGAQSTREQILRASKRLFAKRGYPAATIAAIAKDAGVSVATVTSAYRTKLVLLKAMVKWDVRGDELPLPLAERAWWKDMLQEPNAPERLRRYAANVRQIHERTTDIFAIVQSAAAVEPAIAALRRELGASHYGDDGVMVASLAKIAALKPELTVATATDLLWVLGSADLYRLFVVERGWTALKYEQWLGATWVHSLLESA
ncbi:MAG: TetR/AcrR family transcriptional regulator [Gemmatimonadota bacterium]|nr:TetR/AcrR family transcriptional regulator [Gemmatimonadota bacterium]